MRNICRARFVACLLLFFTLTLCAETPHWIWGGSKGAAIQPNETCFLRRTFHTEAKPDKAVLTVAADDEAIVFINGRQIVRPKGYDKPAVEDVTRDIKKGENVIAIRAKSGKPEQAGV